MSNPDQKLQSIPTNIQEVSLGETGKIAVFSNGHGVYGWQPSKEDIQMQQITLTPSQKEWIAIRTGHIWFDLQQDEQFTVFTDASANYQAISGEPIAVPAPYYGIEDFTDDKPHKPHETEL